ncbi:MAG: hypothetical protein CMO44_03360, partial [Verrucomicrobiales bacterium]|nr:hypothetical protein [Verrucomicrobiales bacterium]
MRFLFRWTFRLLILMLVLAIGLFLTKDALTKWWIVSEFREQGMDVQIGQLEIGFPLNSTIAANKITVFNLPEYGGSSMLKIDDLFIDCDLSELMNFRRKLKPHFRQIRIRIEEFNLVETNKGSRNLISLPDAVAKTTAQLALDDSPLYFHQRNEYQDQGLLFCRFCCSGKQATCDFLPGILPQRGHNAELHDLLKKHMYTF